MDLIGQNLGQYRIIEPIGAGGMATVFKAYQPGLDRYVAIKVLPAQHALTPGFKERFAREARAVAQLSHPNILAIYDVGIEDDISYFVMKYVPGRTLKDVMGKSISLEKVCDYIDQLAGALDHAHEKGILHRDIKPVNVLVEEKWLLLADFGLAKIVEGTEALTATGSSMGTPAYVSPEQATGKPVDHRTDIYSLGIVLYEMATGQVPYSGETPMGVMFKHVHEPLPLPRVVKPDLPEAVERVILKTLAKNPDDRYNSAGDLAKALREAVETAAPEAVLPASPSDLEQTVAHSAGATSPAGLEDESTQEPSEPAIRGQTPWVWVGLGLVATVIVASLIFVTSSNDSDPPAVSQQEQIIADTEDGSEALNGSATPDSPEIGTTSTVELATHSSAAPTATTTPTSEPTEAVVTPPATLPPPTAATTAGTTGARIISDIPVISASALLGRGPINEIAASPDSETLAVASSLGVWLYDLQSLDFLQLLESQDTGVAAVAWSPEGRQLALGNENGQIQLWDLNTQETQILSGAASPVVSIAWSPNGVQQAAGSEDASIRVWDVSSGQEVVTLTGHLYEPYGLAWAPEGNQVASASRDMTIRVWDVASGGELHRLEGHLDEVNSIDWSPDGNQLLTSSNDLTIRVWNTDEWQEENIFTGHTDWVLNAAWSPDGTRVASGGFDGTVRIWDAATGEEQLLLEGHTQPGVIAEWTADGTLVVSGGADGTLRVWDVATGEEVGRIAGHTSLLRDVAWSPEGEQLAAVGFDGAVHVWDTATAEEFQTLATAGEFLLSTAWSPDGRQVAAGNFQGSITIWDVLGGQAIQTLTGHSGPINSVAWSPGGTELASASDDGVILLWDAASGAKLRELASHVDAVNSVAWSPDGTQLASASDDRLIVVWEAESGAPVRQLEGRTASEAYKYYYPARGTNWVKSLDWSADGRRLAAGSSDYVVRVWDAASGAELRMLEGPEVPVLSVAWGADSERLALTGVGGRRNITIWHAIKDQPLYNLHGHVDTIYSMDWSPDGTQLASVGNDGVIRVWDIPVE